MADTNFLQFASCKKEAIYLDGKLRIIKYGYICAKEPRKITNQQNKRTRTNTKQEL